MKTSRLEKFLINRNLLETFKRNYNKQSTGMPFIMFIKIFGTDIYAIESAFTWADTPEKYIFWSKIEDEWLVCLKTNTL